MASVRSGDGSVQGQGWQQHGNTDHRCTKSKDVDVPKDAAGKKATKAEVWSDSKSTVTIWT